MADIASHGTESSHLPHAAAPEGAPALDLSRIRHDLRTPINHILGYCEMLQEDETVPGDFQSDLRKIHGGGRRLLALINEYFDEATFHERRRGVHVLSHELRTPVNHIVGYSELLQEQAEERGLVHLVPDLKRILDAGLEWLRRMEEHLLGGGVADGLRAGEAPPLLRPGVDFIPPAPGPAGRVKPAECQLLVADDDPSNRDLLTRRLLRHGYQVTSAATGGEALELLRVRRFDLVLLDMIMPGMDGYEVLLRIKADPVLGGIPVIIISSLDQESSVARCIEAGAEDYVGKPFNAVFLRARIGACLERKRLLDQERRVFEALRRSQQALTDELAEAAAYVRSLLPAPMGDGPVRVDWRFKPSTQLGGDALGYHWLDDRHFAFFLLDVCGHGVGAALLSVSVMNVLKSRSMPGVDNTDPGAVLRALNRAFDMERHNNMFFTIWYGVLAVDTRELAFACGGHPPAVLSVAGEPRQETLASAGPIVGGFPEAAYSTARRILPPGSRVHVFSDGIYELARADGSTVQLEEFVAELGRAGASTKLDDLLDWASGIRASAGFEDDISILELRLD